MYGVVFALLVLSGLGGRAKAGGGRRISGQAGCATRPGIEGRHGAVQTIGERSLGSLAHVRGVVRAGAGSGKSSARMLRPGARSESQYGGH